MAAATWHTTDDHIAEIRVQKRVWGHTHGECVDTLTFFQMEGRVAIGNDRHGNAAYRHRNTWRHRGTRYPDPTRRKASGHGSVGAKAKPVTSRIPNAADASGFPGRTEEFRNLQEKYIKIVKLNVTILLYLML